MGFREIKAKARGDLHARMKVPALYYAPGSTTGVACSVRIHTKLNKQQGDLAGTNFSYAEQEEHIPAVLFWIDEVDPTNKAVVMIASDEGYRVSVVRQPDGPTILAEVARLTTTELGRYAAPDGSSPHGGNGADIGEIGDWYDSM